MDSLPGYTLLEELHRTTRTAVYRMEREDGESVILKTHAAPSPTPSWLALLRHEYEILRALEEVDEVITPRQLMRHGVRHGLVLEDDQAVDLRALVHRQRPCLRERLVIVAEVVRALASIHARKIVHKDINPRNIIHDSRTGRTRLIDFGIASMIPRENIPLCNPGLLEGTVAYMAPEQTGRMNRPVDYRADFYSVGVVLYELATGRRPFESEDALEMIHAHLARTPTVPGDIDPTLPGPLSDLIMRLLEKSPENRYQSAHGLVADLNAIIERVWPDGDEDGPGLVELGDFKIGNFDLCDQLNISEQLYGRSDQVEILLNSFDRAARGRAELLLVAGGAGMGKSSLIREIHRPIADRRGYFIAGSFDERQRDIPYVSLIQAFTDLVHQILTEPEDAVNMWRDRLTAALGKNGQVIVDVIPEVAHIIGPQSPAPPLPPEAASSRFNQVFLQFVHTFARPDRPLAIFLDDMHWADMPSLGIIELLLGDSGTSNLLLIGAYRHDELAGAHSPDPDRPNTHLPGVHSPGVHPLNRTLARIRDAGARVTTITLQPLDVSAVEALLRDTFHADPESIRVLAALCLEKSAGSPLLLHELLNTFHEEKLIWLGMPEPGQPQTPGWRWDIAALRKSPISDNAASLLVDRVARLDSHAQHALRCAACIGVRFSLGMLAAVLECSLRDAALHIWRAIQHDLVLLDADDERVFTVLIRNPSEGSSNASERIIDDAVAADIELRFRHDRIHWAAYSLVEVEQRGHIHLQIGRLLLHSHGTPQGDEGLFVALQHFNRFRELLADTAERLAVAQLNLDAGRRALNSAAHLLAGTYLAIGLDLLGSDPWAADPALAMALYRERARAELLAGDLEACEACISEAIAHTHDPIARAELLRLRIERCTLKASYHAACQAARTAFADLGFDVDAGPDLDSEIAVERDRLREYLATHPIASLAQLPAAHSRRIEAFYAIAEAIGTSCFFADMQFWNWICVKSVGLALEYGNMPSASIGYVAHAVFLTTEGRYRDAYEFAQVALALVRRNDIAGEFCRVFAALAGFVMHLGQPLTSLDALYSEALNEGRDMGQIYHCGHLTVSWTIQRFYAGIPLSELRKLVADGLQRCKLVPYVNLDDSLEALGAAAACLAGDTPSSRSLDQRHLSEEALVKRMDDHWTLLAKGYYFAFKAQVLYLHGAYDEALRCTHSCLSYLPRTSQYAVIENLWYQSLALLALAGPHSAGSLDGMERVRANLRLFAVWAAQTPQNFLHQLCLIQAEMARVESRGWDAIKYYNQALEAVRKQGLLQDEALIHERAGYFWLASGQSSYAYYHLQQARNAYAAWGAERKVTLIEAELPALVSEQAAAMPFGSPSAAAVDITTMSTSEGSSLDLASVIKASQTLSSSIVLGDLLRRLLQITIENAGAERGCLVRRHGDHWHLEVTADTAGTPAFLTPSIPLHRAGAQVPLSIVDYVHRLGVEVVLGDAMAAPAFAYDPYIRKHRPRSVLCAPIVSQSRTIGILYLENRLTCEAFSADRVEILHILSSQAAISLDNAQLYSDLQELNTELEQRVTERTTQLRAAQAALVERAHQAGMAEVAIDVLHNVGNALNTLRVSASLMRSVLQNPSAVRYREANALLRQHAGRLEEFFAHDPRGAQLVDYYSAVEERSANEMVGLLDNANEILAQVDAIEAVIRAQQAYVKAQGAPEAIPVIEVLEDTLVLRNQWLSQRNIEIRRDYRQAAAIRAHRSRIIHVLLKIYKNAEDAVLDCDAPCITIAVDADECNAYIRVTDNGVGIPEQDRHKAFQQGYTTKVGGQGFSLHSAANYIRRMGGRVWLESDGPGRGATAVICLPRVAEPGRASGSAATSAAGATTM